MTALTSEPAQDLIVTVEERGVHYKLFLPHASQDHIQKLIRGSGAPYERAMLRDMAKRLSPGDLVADVGANIGNHSVYLARVAGARVLAFEPNFALCAVLERSLVLNGLEDQVQLWRKGLGAKADQAHFTTDMPENLGSQTLALGEGEVVVVPFDSLTQDSEGPNRLEGPVRMMKIDVEGMELDVLRGAEATISRDRPILYLESHQKAAFEALVDWARTHGYAYWETFNATPTHLFLPLEMADEAEALRRLTRWTAFLDQPHRSEQLCKARKAAQTAEAARSDLLARIALHEDELDALRMELGEARAALAQSQAQLEAQLEAAAAERMRVSVVLATERAAARNAALAGERRLGEVRNDLGRAQSEILKLEKYGRELEQRHLDTLQSEAWRATAPARALLQKMRGRPARPAFKPKLLKRKVSAAEPAPVAASPAETRLFAPLAQIERSQNVYAFLATYPAREMNLPQIVAAILPQCDVLDVYLNEYEHVPECLRHERIVVTMGKDTGGNLKDNGRFYNCGLYPDGYHVFVDDDIFYPPDYVAKLTQGIRRFGYRTIVGLHGTTYREPVSSYLRDRSVLPFYARTPSALVDQLGTGTTAYHTSTFMADLAAFETEGVADLWFARQAAEKGVPMLALAREKDWLVAMPEIGETIFRQMQRDDSKESALLAERLAPALRQGPRAGAARLAGSLYAEAHLARHGLDLGLSRDGAFGVLPDTPPIRFSLIITGWNCVDLVDACFGSLERLQAGGFDFEILAYDDASDDGTWDKLSAWSDRLNLQVFRGEENLGPAFARDFLLRRVEGDDRICVLLDMDDQLLSHALRELERIYRESPDCWMTYGNWVNQHGVVNTEGVYSPEEIDSRAYRRQDVFKFTHLRSFRRFLYDRVEPRHLKDPDGAWLRYCSDVGLMLPIADQCAGRNVVALTEPLYLYVQYRASGTQKRFRGQKRTVFLYLRDDPALFRHG